MGTVIERLRQIERARYRLTSVCLGRPLSCRCRGSPRSNGCLLHATASIPVAANGPAAHAASYRYSDFFSSRIVFALLLPFSLEQQADRCTQIGQTLLFRLTLSVGTGDLETGGPKSAFVRFAWMNYGCKLCHGVKIGRTRGPSSPTKAGPPEDGRIVRRARSTVDGCRRATRWTVATKSRRGQFYDCHPLLRLLVLRMPATRCVRRLHRDRDGSHAVPSKRAVSTVSPSTVHRPPD